MNAVVADRDPSEEETPPARATYRRHATNDREEAEQVITDLYLPHRLDPITGPDPLQMEVTGLRLGALTAGRLTYGRRVRLRTVDASDFHVNIPLRGRTLSSHGSSERVATRSGEGLIFSPGAPAEISWSTHCEQLCLMVPRDRLEAELEQLLGRSLERRLAFEFAADVRSPLGQRWRTVLDVILDELDNPTSVGGHPLMSRHLEGLVLDGLLLGQRHNYSDIATGSSGTGMGAAIRRAVKLIQEQPSEPWTSVGLAGEVHLSVRALQEGFRRDVGNAPMAYVRQVRMRRAREQLLAADPEGTTVSSVAAGLGILHLGRFAAAYREAFGEAPSETLNRRA